MDIFSSILFFCLGIAIGWLVFVGFTANPPRDNQRHDGQRDLK